MSSPERIHEGVFAINKPTSITSAQVIRDAQLAFKDSKLFAPWFAREQARREAENHNQRQKRRSWKQRQPLQLKIGHGGTLDPLATGVLILGIGNGTKELSKFLECTKSYETVVLFGVESDSYDVVGKVARRAGYEHITREVVERALEKFRGRIMQRPPVFSALRVKGKRLYEYARAGEEVPVEIEEREVGVEESKLVEWMEGGSHAYRWPTVEVAKKEDAGGDTKRMKVSPAVDELDEKLEEALEAGFDAEAVHETNDRPQAESQLTDTEEAPTDSTTSTTTTELAPPCPAPAVRLKMTVTSGFYVRSLAHDIGLAVGSAGLMASLVRTRQGDFELGKNVLEYDDLVKGEGFWGEKVEGMLSDWAKQKALEDQ